MFDTIAAISTTLGIGAISIIRISGPDSINIINKIFKGKQITEEMDHTINYGFIVEQDEKIDEVLISYMKAPRTFTKEDIIEINCHGGIATTSKVLELVIKAGARLAEPGEFTKRAFLNGRIDLVEAEAVMDLIETKSDQARAVALKNLEGKTSNYLQQLREKITDLLVSIEVNIDYPEYTDITTMTTDIVKPKLSDIINELQNLINKSNDSTIIKEGIKTVILGRPNVGKSSLLNALLDENKAIVTDIAGTTRDIVEGTITINGILLNIIDTAGIRETQDKIESLGVSKSLELLTSADLVILVLNNNEELTNEDLLLLERIKGKPSIIVINKIDLQNKLNINQLKEYSLVMSSMKDKKGILELKATISDMFQLEKINKNDDQFLNSIRQTTLAKEALEILNTAYKNLEQDELDLVELDIKSAWNKLGEITGETYNEELLDNLFSRFCLGK